MLDIELEHPWEQLERLLLDGKTHEVESFVSSLPPGDVAPALLRMPTELQHRVLSLLSPEAAARMLEQIPESEAADLLEAVAPRDAAAIVEELPSDERADILRDIEEPEAEAIMAELPAEQAREARVLTGYADDVAGGIMITEFLSYQEDRTVDEVVRDIRTNADEYRGYDVQYAYVTDNERALVGVLNVRDLLLGAENRPIRSLMAGKPVCVRDTADLDELRALFDRHHFLAVPVVDAAGKLVGVVRSADAEEALRDRGDSDYRKSLGIVGGDELRSLPLFIRCRRRLSWLSINIVLNIAAASIIALYQDTLSAVIALAVFLPIISDMSGCSGNQAVAVTIRELTLGVLRPTEIFRVWQKEILVGLINGAALGLLLGAVAWWWNGNIFLGLVAGAALATNTLVAVSIGGLTPLILRRMKLDPALASGPILTTITDMCGFFLVLSLATLALPRLVAH